MDQNGKKILIVEDSKPIVMLIQQALLEKKFLIGKSVDQGEAVEQAVTSQKPDLILMDIFLNGEMDGIEASQRVLQKHKIPIVYMTAHEDENILERALQTSHYGYLIKPFSQFDLYSAVQSALSKFAMEKEIQQKKRHIQKIRKSAQKALINRIKKNRNEMQQLVSAIDSLMIAVSAQEKIYLWNKYADQIFHIPAAQAIGQKIWNLGLQLEWATLMEGISDAMIEKKSILMADILFISANNEKKTLGLSVNPIFDSKKKITGFLIFGKDITKKRINEMKFLQDQKMISIGELAAGIAHEINTPTQYVGQNITFLQENFFELKDFLAHIRHIPQIAAEKNWHALTALAQQIKDRDIDFILQEIPNALSESTDGINHITTIVKSMKAFAHPDQNKKENVSINQAILDSINLSRNVWKYDSKMTTNLTTEKDDILGHPAEIHQVFLNLIVNAAHAISEAKEKKIIDQGKISITSNIEKNFIDIKIGDNGIGISEENRTRIFDPFFTTKEVGKGTGQGLAISRTIIVEKHNGKIFFESTQNPIDHGTIFIIKLPLSKTKESTVEQK